MTVTEQLDPNLDWSTFQLGSINVGAMTIPIPAGLQSYSTTYNTTSIDGTPLRVEISANLDQQTGLVTWTFLSVDPATGLAPADPVAGFLPVDDSTGRGEAFLNYTVEEKANLATGTQFNARATVVFDTNAPLNTNTTTNTIDAGPVSSTVNPLPVTTTAPFTVSWTGTDVPAGSGIAGYDVFVSDNGGPYKALMTDTTLTSTTFTGSIGHTYGFYSVATDNVGNRQSTPTSAQATTQLVAPAAVLQFASGQFVANLTAGTAMLTLTRSGNLAATVAVLVSSSGGSVVSAFQTTVTFGPNVTTQNVVIPIVNNGLPGTGDAVISLSLTSPAAGAALGATSSASLVIQNDNPPLVMVSSVQVATIQMRTGKKTKKTVGLEIHFNGDLNSAEAQSLAAYKLVTAGRDKKLGTKDDKSVPLASAQYNTSTRTVTLIPKARLNKTQLLQLVVNGRLLIDTRGRPLGGQTGNSFTATIKGKSVTIQQMTASTALSSLAVDHVLDMIRVAPLDIFRTRT